MDDRTIIVENARLELLRCFASLEDYKSEINTREPDKAQYWPTHAPLLETEWQNPVDDVILALEECVKLGHMEASALHAESHPGLRFIAELRGGRDWMVRITPAGYAWIRAHDLIGEAQQEPSDVR